MAIKDIFTQELKVINTGISTFKDELNQNGTKAVQVAWKPPAAVSQEAMQSISSNLDKITRANEEAMKIILTGKPVLTGMSTAIEKIPGMKKNLILHAGPPVTWDRMCGPTRGAIMGALMYEGLASTAEEAEKLASSGDIEYAPCHEHASVGPMAGIVSASMPVFIVKK